MAIYLALLLVILFVGFLKDWNRNDTGKKQFLFFAFALIVLVAALRKYTVGIDLKNQYAEVYTRIANIPWHSWDTLRYEWGYFAFCKLLTYISTDAQFYIIVSSLVIFSAVARFIYKSSQDVVLSTVIFIGFNLMFMYYNVIRQALAIAVLLMGFEKLKKKQYLRYLIVIAIASLFHTSAWLAVLFIAFSIIPFRRKELILSIAIYIVSIVAYRTLYIYIFPFVAQYYGAYELGTQFGRGYMNWYSQLTIFILLLGFAFAYYALVWEKDDIRLRQKRQKRFRMRFKDMTLEIQKHPIKIQSKVETNLLMYGTLAALIFQTFVISINILTRFRHYFFPFLLVSIPAAEKQISEKCQQIVKAIIYCIIIAYFVVVGFTFAKSQFGTVPYEFFFE